MKYIVLRNPHDGRYKLFEHDHMKDKYAPNYGCPIVDGSTVDECLETAKDMFQIKQGDVIE